jgi:hypothetical protein
MSVRALGGDKNVTRRLPAASASMPVKAPSGAATQRASANPESVMTAPSAPPKGTGLWLTPAFASQLAVKLGVTRPPIRRISIYQDAERGARGIFDEVGAGVLDVKGDVDEGQRQDEPGHFQIAPISHDGHFLRD